jgi:cation diffusion facilitator family transporter
MQETHDHPHEHFGALDSTLLSTRLGVRATWISLVALAGTALLQLAIVAVSGSVALLADTIHNFTDALTAIPLLIAFRLGRRPPSRRYPYGLHRAEDLAGVAIVLTILASAVFAGAEAIDRLLHPREPEAVGLVLIAGIIGFVGNETVALYRIRVGRRIGSAALVADGLHARTDGFTSLGVVVSALATIVGIERADPVVALAITGVIAWTLVRAARAVIHRILDGSDEDTIALIETVASSIEGVEHVTEAKARWTGHRLRAELSIDVDPGISVEEGHDIAERVRSALLTGVPRLTDAAVHVDPHEHDSHRPG